MTNALQEDEPVAWADDASMHGLIQWIAFLPSGLLFGFFTWMTIMTGVWGVRIHPIFYLALLSCLLLAVSSFVSLSAPKEGRILAIISLIGIGTVWIPSVAGLIPQHGVRVFLTGYLLFAAYFISIAFALFFPRPLRWSWLTLAVLSAGTLAYGGVVYHNRLQQGEYSRPSFAFFYWDATDQTALVVIDDGGRWIDPETRALLEDSGVRGTLKWRGASGLRSSPNQVIILAQRQPAGTTKIHYPRDSRIVYAYNGSQWLTFPDNAPTYESFATLESEDSTTMLGQDIAGGRQGTLAFTW
jgi:hypothetical protein